MHPHAEPGAASGTLARLARSAPVAVRCGAIAKRDTDSAEANGSAHLRLTAGAGGDRGAPYERAGAQGSSDVHPNAEPGAASETSWIRLPRPFCFDSCDVNI